MLTYYDRAVGIVCLESDVFEHEPICRNCLACCRHLL